MDNIPNLFASLNSYVIGGSSVFLILVGSLIYKFSRKNNSIKNKYQHKQKSSKNAVAQSSHDFDPDTYTVETEENVNMPKNLSGPVVLRNRNATPNPENIKVNKSLDKNILLDEDKDSSDPLYYIDLSKSLDRKGNRLGAIQSLKKSIFFQQDKNEKLKLESILHKYESDLFCNLKELLMSKDSSNDYLDEYIPPASFTYISQQKSFPKLDNDIGSTLPVVPTLTNTHLNKVVPRFTDMDNLDMPQFSNLNKNARVSDINEIDDLSLPFTTPEDLVNAINNNNIDSTFYQTKEINMSEAKSFSPENLPNPNFSHDIWIHWMSTANGKTSFKDNIIHLKNPWSSKKSILELTEILNKECRNSDGTPASWSILSIHPFFDF